MYIPVFRLKNRFNSSMKMNIRLILTGNNNVHQLKLPFRLNKRVSGLYILIFMLLNQVHVLLKAVV